MTASYPHTPEDIEKFNAKVDRSRPDECWRWIGATFDERGYGVFTLKRKAVRAHRFAYYVAHGDPMPPGMVVMHTCDNPSCVRPDHLVLGTQLDNVQDRQAKGRQATWRTHPRAKLTAEQVSAIRMDERGQRTIAADYMVSRTLVQVIKQGKVRNGSEQAALDQKMKARGG